MKRWTLWLLLLGLAACVRTEQPNTGTGEWIQMEGKLITVYPQPETPAPTATPYVPQMNGSLVEIDMTIAAFQPNFNVSMQQTQTLHLFSSLNNIPSFEWGIQFDPTTITATLNSQPLASIEGFTFDEPKKILLTPLAPGTIVITVFLQYRPCVGCEMIFTKTPYTITVK